MTTGTDILAIEVAEGTDALREALVVKGLQPRLDRRSLLVPLSDEDNYDIILRTVAELDLPLHRLEQRHHRVAELFAIEREASHVG